MISISHLQKIEHQHWMLSFIYECSNVGTLYSWQFFDVAKFTILTPLSLQISCKLLFPIVGLKIYSLHTFTLKFPNRIFMWYFRNLSNMCSTSVLCIITFILGWCMYIRTVISHWHPVTNKFYLLNCWYDSLMYEKASPYVISIPISIEKCIICWLTCHPCYIWSLLLPLDVSYTVLINLVLFSVKKSHRDSWHSKDMSNPKALCNIS
jgi:hypothetical protein